ncbi:beta-etherase [Novosphingobium umbonatum]|nr:beta-etherase [Novosphingobium umbonatum]
MMAKDNKITFYDLQHASGCTTSPFVWATKYAIAHKGFELDIVDGGFTGIMDRTGGRSERLPAIQDDGEWVLDSWLIAEYLDEKYPDRPTLIGDPSIKPLAQFLETWLWKTVVGPWARAFAVEYRDRCKPEDIQYITESRLRMWGKPMEELVVGREDVFPKVLPELELLRGILREHKWLGGESPNYADYRALAVFLWAASVADTPPMTEDEPLRDWIERGFDLFGGLGRHPGMSPLFGLKMREGDPEPFAKGPSLVAGLVKRNTGPASTRAETDHITGKGEKTPA